MSMFKTLGEARTQARANAKRDGCRWRIYGNKWGTIFKYQICDEHHTFAGEKLIETVDGGSRPITLTKEEAELVEYILREDIQTISPEADDAETRRSTWKKIKKYLAQL